MLILCWFGNFDTYKNDVSPAIVAYVERVVFTFNSLFNSQFIQHCFFLSTSLSLHLMASFMSAPHRLSLSGTGPRRSWWASPTRRQSTSGPAVASSPSSSSGNLSSPDNMRWISWTRSLTSWASRTRRTGRRTRPCWGATSRRVDFRVKILKISYRKSTLKPRIF